MIATVFPIQKTTSGQIVGTEFTQMWARRGRGEQPSVLWMSPDER
jgi:hypothetical protein